MTANKRRSILWTVAGAIALMVPGYLLTDSSDPTPMRADATHTMICERGQRASYRLRTVSDITMTANPSAHQETTATLELCVLEVDGTAAEFGFRFAAVDFATDGVRDAARATAMATPFVVRFEQGNVVESRFPDGLADTTRRQLDALIRSFQCTLPPGSEPVLAIEKDGLGRYRAEYAWTSPGTVSRRKTAYLSGMAAGGVPCDVRVIDAHAELTPAARGPWLRQATISERLELSSLGSLAVKIDQRTTLELQATTNAVVPLTAQGWLADAEAAVASSRQIEADVAPTATRSPSAAERREFLAALEQFVAGGGTDMAAVHALARKLTEMPELTAEVEQVLRRPQLPAKVAAGLCHSLELAGGEPCQQSLAEVGLDGRLPADLRFCAAAALGGVPQPSVATEAALLRLTGDADPSLAASAQLAFGNMANALRTHDEQRYRAVRDVVADRVTGAGDTDATVVALRAAGNTRDAELAPVALTRLHDTEASVRAAAAETAGKLGGATVAADLERALRTEPDGRVRAAMVRGLVASGDVDTACRVCAQLIEHERDETARSAMAHVLADHVAERPELRPVLARLLERETSASIASDVAGRLYRAAK